MSSETKLVAVATDGSAGATLAVEWAASFARSLGAELLAIQVVAPPPEPEPAELDAGAGNGGSPDAIEEQAAPPTDGLARARGPARGARELVAGRGDHRPRRGRIRRGHRRRDPRRRRRADADVVVVGSSGMRGRKEFLLGNVANRVTHLADCTVVIVNTATGEPVSAAAPDSGPLKARAREIGRVLGPVAVRQLSGRLLRSEGDPDGPRRAARGVRAARADLRQARPDPLDPPRPDLRGVRRRARRPAVGRAADVRGRGRGDDGARARRALGGRLLLDRARAARRRDDRPGAPGADGRRHPRGGQGAAPGRRGGGRRTTSPCSR